ncbi:MAG TPA: glycosyltransferase family 2 protein [Nevskiaceae bacterium]|nr:glycosyltransferase family 2 protein [Nevskiaceae bacterium]
MISAVVLAKNEEKNIRNCLKSLQWCDEIVVIDDYSEDKTLTIARRFGAKVYQRHLAGDFATQRNFGLKQAKREWVLFIDADERVSAVLAREIRQVAQGNFLAGFYLKRQDWLWGKALKHGETVKVKLLRLGKKGAGEWQRKVHETWEIKDKTGQLKNPIIHYPHQTISEFLSHLNFHSSLHAEALKKEGIKPSFFRVLINPFGKFIQNYFFQLGFLDGMPGLISALMMSFHSFLARAKLYSQ